VTWTALAPGCCKLGPVGKKRPQGTHLICVADELYLRDVQIAARHADPRTTMRYDRARQNLDRHPNYILAACMASGT